MSTQMYRQTGLFLNTAGRPIHEVTGQSHQSDQPCLSLDLGVEGARSWHAGFRGGSGDCLCSKSSIPITINAFSAAPDRLFECIKRSKCVELATGLARRSKVRSKVCSERRLSVPPSLDGNKIIDLSSIRRRLKRETTRRSCAACAQTLQPRSPALS